MTGPVQTKSDVLGALQRHAKELRRLGVKRVGIFGSFARAEQSERSDLDLLVEFEEGQKTFDHFVQLAFFLEDTLQRRVDLVTPDALCSHLRSQILDEVEYASIAA
jgi:predicted nucleotidyltransferase